MATGTVVFWAGLFRLVVMSARLALDVLKGDHPYTAVARLGVRRDARSDAKQS